MLTLCALYVAQGIPWGFVSVTFAAWLAQPENELTTEQIGPILGVATLPWSFKFVWGPLMDRFTIPSLGRRRPWIIFAQTMAILTLGSMLFVEDMTVMEWSREAEHNWLVNVFRSLVPGPLAAMILAANVFVSMQDVAVDALAVDLLEEDERGAVNGLMYGSSYLGTALGGSGLGLLVAHYGIKAGIAGQIALLSLIMLMPIFFRERRGVANPDSGTDSKELPLDGPHKASHPETKTILAVFFDLLKAFSLRSAILGIVIALGAKIGIGVLTAVFVSYLQKEGGWTMEQYTTVTGGYAVALGLIGAALGGFAADQFGTKRIIVTTSVLLGVLWVSFGLFPAAIASHKLVTLLLLSQEFLFAMLSVALFALFMSISWPKVAATQFTSYMALMNLSTTIGSYSAGKLSKSADIFQILILAGLLQAAMVIPVLFIDERQTRRELGNGE